MYKEIAILINADKNTTSPKPKIVDEATSSKPKGLKKKNIKVTNKQTFKVESISGTKPRVYGNGSLIFFIKFKIVIY